MISLLIFIIVLSVLIVVHEWGHFIAARKLGICVETFSIGFGPKLFSKNIGGTDFVVSAIPLGGYVKLLGDDRSECKGLAEEFYSHSVWHRAVVIAMGPIVNFVFAYLCFVFLFSVTGYPIFDNHVGEVMPGYPAYSAGFRAGDRVVRIDDRNIVKWVDLQVAVSESEGRPLDFVVERDGRDMTIQDVVPTFESFGVEGETERVPVVGLKPVLQKYGIGKSLVSAAKELWSVVAMTSEALYKVVTGAESAKDKLAGPIRIFDVVRDAAKMGFAYLVFIVAVISTSLGFFNLFPIPILDGGHLFFLCIEGVRRRPLPIKVEERCMQVGLSLLMCLMAFVLYNDIVQVGWADKVAQFFGRIF